MSLFYASDFFIFGESYGGKYIPDLAYGIHKGNFQPRLKSQENIKINLRGIGIGNGWMSPVDQGKYASFLYYHGMLDGEQYLTLLQLEEELISMVMINKIHFSFILMGLNQINIRKTGLLVMKLLNFRLRMKTGMALGKHRTRN